MKVWRIVWIAIVMLVFGFVWGLSFGAAEALQRVAAAQPNEGPSAPVFARAVEPESVPVRLVLEGHEFVENACIPAHIRLIAMRYGSWRGCFDALSQGGATPREICNWTAYPFGEHLAAWLARYECYPVDAAVEVGDTAPRVRPHRDGRTVGDDALLDAVAACLEGTPAPALVLRPALAAVRTPDLERRISLVATYATPYADSPSRVHNLRLACRALNGSVLESGQELSFNQTVGARTAERGYLPAKIIRDGAFVEGVGGGVCQVSTTLYNAAMAAGLTQVEAHPHSRAVHYVAPARDAMVSGWSDMRIRNDSPHPVYVYATAAEGKVSVRIYGAPLAHRVRLETHSRVAEPYRNVDEQGRPLADTEGYERIVEGQNALAATLVRITGDTRQTLRRCAYPRRDAVWRPLPDTSPDEAQ